MKVFLYVKTKVEQDEYGESRTRYNYSVQSGNHAPIGIDVVYEKDPKTGKDPLYMEYRSVLGAFSDDLDQPVGVEPVELLCLPQNGGNAFYLLCGNVTVPIRVPDYSTAGKPDNGRRLRVTVLYSLARLIKRKPAGLLSVSGVAAVDEEAPTEESPAVLTEQEGVVPVSDSAEKAGEEPEINPFE